MDEVKVALTNRNIYVDSESKEKLSKNLAKKIETFGAWHPAVEQDFIKTDCSAKNVKFS